MYQLKDVISLLEKGIDEVYYPEQPAGLYLPVKYILSLGGKRVRPALMLLAANMYKENIEGLVSPALAFEIFHNFTLLHDDLMDNAEERRGKPVVHKKWDENTAILSGDAMLIYAYQYINNVEPEFIPLTLDIFSKMALEICEGQQYDMDFESRDGVSQDEYIEMIRLKTAVLLGTALKTGAFVSGADISDCDLLYEFGINIGLAFQLKDDLLDVYGDPAIFGKKIGGDILCNKKTFLLINAYRMASPELQTRLRDLMNNETISSGEKIDSVTQIFTQSGVREYTQQYIEHFYNKAIDALNKVSVKPEKKEVLKALAYDLMYRES